MTDIFISHAAIDERIARFLHQHLSGEGISVFLASTSLRPGQKWPIEVLNALKSSSWVLFLASRAACASPWVQQELGAALVTQKKLVPIVWDMQPSELPGWVHQYEALNLSNASLDDVKAQLTAIANKVKGDKVQGLLFGGLLFAALLALGSK